MIPKQLRNKALSGCYRLITAELDGKPWSAPDGYFAVNVDLYDGYRVKKSQEVPDMKPKLQFILDRLPNQYKAVQSVVPTEGFTLLVNEDTTAKVNTLYLQLLMKLYPNAQMYIASQYDPVKFIENDQLSGLIMPVRQ